LQKTNKIEALKADPGAFDKLGASDSAIDVFGRIEALEPEKLTP